MSTIRENLQANILSLLTSNNISQKQFAEMLGVSQAAVTNWVKGKNSPDIELIAKICNIFNVKISELISLPDTHTDLNLHRLIKNYESLDNKGKNKLVEYSDDLICSGNYSKVITVVEAARSQNNDEPVKTIEVSEDDMAVFDIAPQSDEEI